jgi:hypothetical protein
MTPKQLIETVVRVLDENGKRLAAKYAAEEGPRIVRPKSRNVRAVRKGAQAKKSATRKRR